VQKLLKTIRLDPSDTLIFPKASEGEWAVIGSFLFWERDIAELNGKERQAFRAGFAGVETLGFSTLVEVVSGDKMEAIAQLASTLMRDFAAPTLEDAREAATFEIEQAMALAQHDEGTLIAMHRVVDGDNFREIFRTLTKRDGENAADTLHKDAKAFTFHEIEEEVSLMDLMK
jgi:Family of unknown function (DUF6505)